MEWNTKWDWENLDTFSSKGAASPKKLQSAYWGIEVDGSFNLSSDVVGNNSSTKSSISASTESSSFKEGGMKGSNISFQGFGCLPDSYIEGSNISSSSVCSGEPFIGLKLGKRTYFENSYAKSTNHRTSSSSSILGVPVSSVSMGKKVKPSSQTTPITRCQVEGCNLDLSSSKDYHRKHRVCERHSKCPKVIVGGVERRFCQQCSRFHDMSEFDEEKRSCRRRLSDHNARRRKPQQELNQFNSSIPYSSFYDPPLVQTISSTWESTCNSKYSSSTGGVEFSDALNRGVFHLGFKEPLSSNVDAVDLHHALSLLSNNSNSNSNSWGSSDIPLDHHHHHHRMQHSMPQDSVPPLSSQDYYYYWQQQSIHAKTSTHFQEFQIFKSPPYDNSFPFHPSG